MSSRLHTKEWSIILVPQWGTINPGVTQPGSLEIILLADYGEFAPKVVAGRDLILRKCHLENSCLGAGVLGLWFCGLVLGFQKWPKSKCHRFNMAKWRMLILIFPS